MVRINLFKTPQPRRRPVRRVMPTKTLAVAGGSVAVLIAAALTWWVAGPLLTRSTPPSAPQKKGLPPSSYSGRRGVEETVRDRFEHRQPVNVQTGLLKLPYAEMQESERINYEFLYARQVFQALAGAVPPPPRVQFESLVLDSFERIQAAGLGADESVIREMLTALRAAPLTMHPRPHTTISAAGARYRFVISASTHFGLNTAAPDLDLRLAWLPPRTALSTTVRTVEQVLRENRVEVTSPLSRHSGYKSGQFRRFVYRFEGKGAYNDVVSFAVALVDRRIPCAVQSLSIKALSPTQVQVKGDLLFTFKE